MAFKDLSEALTGYDFGKVVVFDTETTGLNPYGGDEIVSMALCDIEGNDLFSRLIRPRAKRTWKEAQAIHGISPDDVKNSPTLEDVADEIRSHICGDVLVVGYNVGFDISFLMAAGIIESSPKSFDVMMEYAKVRGSKERRNGDGYLWSKLAVCAKCYGYEFNAHDASEDAKATAHCYKALLCDRLYLKSGLPQLSERLSRCRMSQLKQTSENVRELVEGNLLRHADATLVTKPVTRGKNKGLDRYECFVSDKRVGVGSPSDRARIANLLWVDESELPETLECKALLFAGETSPRCECEIPSDAFEQKIMEEAERFAEENGYEWHQCESSMDVKSVEENVGCCVGCFVALIAAVPLFFVLKALALFF